MTVPARVLNSSDIILLLYDNDFIILQLFLLYINKYLFLIVCIDSCPMVECIDVQYA